MVKVLWVHDVAPMVPLLAEADSNLRPAFVERRDERKHFMIKQYCISGSRLKRSHTNLEVVPPGFLMTPLRTPSSGYGAFTYTKGFSSVFYS